MTAATLLPIQKITTTIFLKLKLNGCSCTKCTGFCVIRRGVLIGLPADEGMGTTVSTFIENIFTPKGKVVFLVQRAKRQSQIQHAISFGGTAINPALCLFFVNEGICEIYLRSSFGYKNH